MLSMMIIYLYTKATLIFSNMLSILIIIVIIILWWNAASTSMADMTTHQQCEAKSCGNLPNISYPFALTHDINEQLCGYPSLQIDCNINEEAFLRYDYGGYELPVRKISYETNSALLGVQLLYANQQGCLGVPKLNLSSKALGTNLLRISSKNKLLYLFFICHIPPNGLPTDYVRISSCDSGDVIAHVGGQYTEDPKIDEVMLTLECLTVVTLPFLNDDLRSQNKQQENLLGLYNNTVFLVEWSYCSGNECEDIQEDSCPTSDNSSTCVCPDKEYFQSCNRGSNINRPRRVPPRGPESEGSDNLLEKDIIIILASISASMILVSVVILLLLYKGQPILMSMFGKRNSNNAQKIESFLVDCQYLAPKNYSYSDIKRITKSFGEKLGQGGYGSVYKGALNDGRLVAVKILSNANGNGEDFINEVVSIGRTSHINIVTLLGFCINGAKRALIYDFMPNGSLESYIYSNESKQILDWDKLYDIAIGVARGLEYLHRGCNTRIVHFDIKPHNILLDKDFNPKISDFGLAKLCSQNNSFLSMADPRGTIGFIAPEVFSRQFGTISTKSDVYSYGMLVLEMVGGRRNVNAFAARTSEVYFPNWVYEHLDQYGDLQALGVTLETVDIARKIVLVGLWCIQPMSTNRPSISRVIEMLEGRVSDLHIPPKPFLSSESFNENSTP